MPEPALRNHAVLSLISGDPDDPANVAVSRTWVLDPSAAEAFATAATERFGEPVTAMQPMGKLGTKDGFVVLGRGESGH